MKKWVLGLLLVSVSGLSAFAQGGSRTAVAGTVIDGDDNSPIMQATVQVLSPKDSSMVRGNVTDLDGRFTIAVRPGKYLLKVSYIGYTPYFKDIELARGKRLNLGNIKLATDAIMLGEAVVVAQAPEVTRRLGAGGAGQEAAGSRGGRKRNHHHQRKGNQENHD